MWIIYEKKSLLKSLHHTPLHIKKAYEIWKRIVEFEGIQGLSMIKGYHDETLKGAWKGFCSLRLSLQWRVIYKTHTTQCEIYQNCAKNLVL